MSNGIGRVWAVNAEGGDEGRPNGVGPVWIENADQLGSKLPEPEAGDNGKVLGVTDGSGTLGWVAKGEADLFYVTYNVTTFDEIKAAHDAGKWPVLVDSSGHFVPMVDFDWIGTASSVQFAKFQTSTYLFHADTDGAGYYNVVYYLRLEIDPDMQRTETWYTASGDTSADWNAVSGPRVIRNKPSIPSVDQTYNSASTNAQSGVAVAQAIASIPSASYTAGDGIDITAGDISVKAGTGLEFGNASRQVTSQTVGLTQHINSSNYDSVNVIQPLTPEIFAAIGNNTATVTLSAVPVTDSDFTNWTISGGSGQTAYVVIGKLAKRTSPNSGWSIDTSKAMFLGVAVQTLDANGAVPTNVAYNVHASDNTDSDSTLTWSELTTALAGGTISDYAIFIARKATSPAIGVYPGPAMCSHITGVVDGTVTTGSITYTSTVANALNVSNPLPASAVGDAGKVLKVDSNGDPEWADAQGGGSSYTFEAPLEENNGTVKLLNGNGLTVSKIPGNTPLRFVNEMSDRNGSLGYATGIYGMYSAPGYTNHVQFKIGVSAAIVSAYSTQGKYVLPIFMLPCPEYSGGILYEPDDIWVVTDATIDLGSEIDPPYRDVIMAEFDFSFDANTPHTPKQIKGEGAFNRDRGIFMALAVFNTPNPTSESDMELIGGATLNTDQGTYTWGPAQLKVLLGSVTSIQQVNALPATPDANTLYLIPEA